jgi:hypothetical protein
MNRINPNFKEQSLIEQENLEFIDELFDNLFDNDDLSSDSDKIPDLSNSD